MLHGLFSGGKVVLQQCRLILQPNFQVVFTSFLGGLLFYKKFFLEIAHFLIQTRGIGLLSCNRSFLCICFVFGLELHDLLFLSRMNLDDLLSVGVQQSLERTVDFVVCLLYPLLLLLLCWRIGRKAGHQRSKGKVGKRLLIIVLGFTSTVVTLRGGKWRLFRGSLLGFVFSRFGSSCGRSGRSRHLIHEGSQTSNRRWALQVLNGRRSFQVLDAWWGFQLVNARRCLQLAD
mmetsp:Transcript_38848/g.97889  ORF Transcript_38848/g.97889 Transcript_38848/m.97889 type:complete len:231 (+) Transcript_38848:1191-1883(+)